MIAKNGFLYPNLRGSSDIHIIIYSCTLKKRIQKVITQHDNASVCGPAHFRIVEIILMKSFK